MQEASGKMIQYRTQVIKRIPVNEYFASRNCRCSRLVIDHAYSKMQCITLRFSVTKRMLACSSRLRSERAGKKGLWSRITNNNYDNYCARNYGYKVLCKKKISKKRTTKLVAGAFQSQRFPQTFPRFGNTMSRRLNFATPFPR